MKSISIQSQIDLRALEKIFVLDWFKLQFKPRSLILKILT